MRFIDYLKLSENGMIVESDQDASNAYEVLIHRIIRKASKIISNLKIGKKNPTNADTRSSFSDDAVLFYNGERVPIEIKLNYKTQFGNNSFSHVIGTDEFIPIQPVEDDESDTIDLLIDSLRRNKDVIDELYQTMKRSAPKSQWGMFKDKYTDTVPIGGFRAISDRKQLPTEKIGPLLIKKHYNRKGVYYIQIGGSGFYYIGSDILNLGIPALDEEFVTEIRLKPSGVKIVGGIEKVTVQIVATGRIAKKPTPSPVSIDNLDDVIKLFGEVGENF